MGIPYAGGTPNAEDLVPRSWVDLVKAPKADAELTGTTTIQNLKLMNGAVAGRFLKVLGDGTAIWVPGPMISDVSSAWATVQDTIFGNQVILYDTTIKRFKIGDGTSTVAQLPWINDPGGSDYEQRNMFQTTGVDLTLTLPTTPTIYLMRLYEIRTSAAVTITIPNTVKLTTGMSYTLAVPSGKSAFIGLRYSIATSAWYLMSMTVEL